MSNFRSRYLSMLCIPDPYGYFQGNMMITCWNCKALSGTTRRLFVASESDSLYNGWTRQPGNSKWTFAPQFKINIINNPETVTWQPTTNPQKGPLLTCKDMGLSEISGKTSKSSRLSSCFLSNKLPCKVLFVFWFPATPIAETGWSGFTTASQWKSFRFAAAAATLLGEVDPALNHGVGQQLLQGVVPQWA